MNINPSKQIFQRLIFLCILNLICIELIACESQEPTTKLQANLYLDAQINPQTDQFNPIDLSVINQAVLDQAVPDQAVLDQAVLDQAVLDQAVLDQAVLDQAVLDQGPLILPETCQILFQVSFPQSTPANDPIMITGDLFEPPWQEAPMAGLMRRDGYAAQLILSLPQGQNIEYKFTRGSWSLIEKANNCQEAPNRTLFVRCLDEMPVVVAAQVINWRNFDGCLQ